MKTENYTAAQTQAIVKAYAIGTTVEALAAEHGRSERSIIAKLVKEGVYVAKTPAATKKSLTKAELAKAIAHELGLDNLESFEKATKVDLENTLAALRRITEATLVEQPLITNTGVRNTQSARVA